MIPKKNSEAANCYPITITEPSKRLKSLLPVMTMALKVAPFYNGAATIAHMFDIPLPKIPQGALDWLKKEEKFINDGSNVKGDGMHEAIELGMIESKTEEGGQKEVKVKGQALRDLENQLHEKDSNRTYCGMRRIMTKDGQVLFALEDSIEQNQDMFPGHEAQAKLEKENRSLRVKLEEQQGGQPAAAGGGAADEASSSLAATASSAEVEDLQAQLRAALDKVKRLEASRVEERAAGSPQGSESGSPSGKERRESMFESPAGLQAKMKSADMIGKKIIIEGFPNPAEVVSFEKSSSRFKSDSVHLVRFDGDGDDVEPTRVSLIRTKNGRCIGTRFVILA